MVVGISDEEGFISVVSWGSVNNGFSNSNQKLSNRNGENLNVFLCYITFGVATFREIGKSRGISLARENSGNVDGNKKIFLNVTEFCGIGNIFLCNCYYFGNVQI